MLRVEIFIKPGPLRLKKKRIIALFNESIIFSSLDQMSQKIILKENRNPTMSFMMNLLKRYEIMIMSVVIVRAL